MVEISGIQKSKEEDCEKIAINISSKVVIKIGKEDIAAAYFISKPDKAAIIVKLKLRKDARKYAQKMLSRDVKTELRKLRVSDLGVAMPQLDTTSSNSGKVYIN